MPYRRLSAAARPGSPTLPGSRPAIRCHCATVTGWIEKGFPWIVFFWCGTLIYLCLMMLKKKTQVLNVADR